MNQLDSDWVLLPLMNGKTDIHSVLRTHCRTRSIRRSLCSWGWIWALGSQVILLFPPLFHSCVPCSFLPLYFLQPFSPDCFFCSRALFLHGVPGDLLLCSCFLPFSVLHILHAVFFFPVFPIRFFLCSCPAQVFSTCLMYFPLPPGHICPFGFSLAFPS